MQDKVDTRKMIPVRPDTHEMLKREKHKQSIERSRNVTFDELLRDKFTPLVTKK